MKIPSDLKIALEISFITAMIFVDFLIRIFSTNPHFQYEIFTFPESASSELPINPTLQTRPLPSEGKISQAERPRLERPLFCPLRCLVSLRLWCR